jgi:hypothetical protein
MKEIPLTQGKVALKGAIPIKHWEVQWAADFVLDKKSAEVVWESRRFLTFKSALRYIRRHPDKALRLNHIKLVRGKDDRTALYIANPEGYWVQQGEPNRALNLSTGEHYRIQRAK